MQPNSVFHAKLSLPQTTLTSVCFRLDTVVLHSSTQRSF